MKDPLFYKDELDGRTGSLKEDEVAELANILKKEEVKHDIKQSTNLLLENGKREKSLDITQFLVDSTRYRTEDGSIDVLEYMVDDSYFRVSGKVMEDKFLISEFYINKKPLEKVVHVNDEDETIIVNIEWK